MKNNSFIYLMLFSLSVALFFQSCRGNDGGRGIDTSIPDFDFPTSIVFEQNLSAYDIFQGTPRNLEPTSDYHLMELSSILYTDYAKKQRLVKVPEGEQMVRNNDGSIDFPDGTILVKTFFYYNDERDTTLGKRIIETRLLIKETDIWNIATYLWNEEQTDASLLLTGLDTPINWINLSGINRSTIYHVPDEDECIACHQGNDQMIPLGTNLRNLNRSVVRTSLPQNQIEYLQSIGVLNNFNTSLVSKIVDYNDVSISTANRARAYLDLNCAHCHNPTAWERPADADLDFRYETPLSQTGISQEVDRIENLVVDGEMPLIGTTLLDDEGVNLIIQYIQNL